MMRLRASHQGTPWDDGEEREGERLRDEARERWR